MSVSKPDDNTKNSMKCQFFRDLQWKTSNKGKVEYTDLCMHSIFLIS